MQHFNLESSDCSWITKERPAMLDSASPVNLTSSEEIKTGTTPTALATISSKSPAERKQYSRGPSLLDGYLITRM